MRLAWGLGPAPDAFLLVFNLMYICYLDESGTREPQANTSHFVLLGLAVPADKWKAKDIEIVAVKAKYGLENAEVHTAWLARDYPEQATVPGFMNMSWPD